MTKNVVFGIIGLVILLLLAVFAESILPLCFIAAFLLISPGSLLLGRVFGKKLSASLSLEELSEKERDINGTLEVRNDSVFPFPVIRAEVKTENRLTGEETVCTVPLAVASKGRDSVAFALSARHCGKILVSVPRLRVCDFFGLLSFSVPITAKKETLVLPELFPTDVVVVKSGVTEPECDTFSPYRSGNDPSETFGIRDYEPGDALRSVHWKLTGKYDRLVIREASLPINESVLILFERICPEQTAFSSPEARNALGEIMLSLSNRLTEMNLAHTVGWLREDGGAFLSHRIDSEESFQLVMAEVLSVSEIRGQEDTAEAYLKTAEHGEYSNIVYIASHESECFSLLSPMAKKTVILCGEDKNDFCTEAGIYQVTPQNYREALMQIMI